jgi:hypothetical protein
MRKMKRIGRAVVQREWIYSIHVEHADVPLASKCRPPPQAAQAMVIVQRARDTLRDGTITGGQVVWPDAKSNEGPRVSEVWDCVEDVVRNPRLHNRERMVDTGTAAHPPPEMARADLPAPA